MRLKDDFQSVLYSLGTLNMFILNIISSHSMECELMLFVTFKPFKFFFPTASLMFTAAKLFHQVIRERTKHRALTASHP